ncbi:hypothetical protein PHMEG_00013234 [Phytophthora megakarya]|uniref:Uncharacterized protein n=1 Tax=Phytophthora megakarya TaxID=4795 RepID=A0A225W9D1_9STRA|nr:hypothetical protein PHMEG_00013234 [Phytophthora megakarya]
MEAVSEKVLQELFQQHNVQLLAGIDNQAAHVILPTADTRDTSNCGGTTLYKVKGETNPADTFTKPLNKK